MHSAIISLQRLCTKLAGHKSLRTSRQQVLVQLAPNPSHRIQTRRHLLRGKRLLGADYMRWASPVSRAGSVCRDLGTSVKHIKNQCCDYVEKSQPG